MTVKSILATLTIIVVALSCTVIEEQEDILLPGADDSEYTSVSMILPQVEILEEDPLTKMTVNVQSNPVAYLWAEKDTVGIFPDKGSQIYFSMADGVGTSKVSFDGGGWALKKNSSYYSYFPFVPDFYIRKDAIPINFEGQSQLGNADPNVADVGRYCYMAAAGDSDPDTGNLTFKYERLGVISRFQIPVDPGTYTSLTIKPGSSVLAYKGAYNATEIDQIIYEPTYSDELSLALEEVTFTEPAVLVAFMMLPPFDIKGKQLTVELTKSDGTVVTSSAFGKNYALGTAQGSSMNFSVYGRNASIDGIDGTVQVVITGSTTRPHSYTVSTDVDWLTLGSYPTSGSAVINVTAAKGTGTARFGHVIVSEQVTSGGTTITLQNKVKITQDSKGIGVGLYADLSAEGTANSYIVSQAGDYKFGAVKGNSSEPVGAVASTEVLWESFGTATAPSEGDLVKEVSYSDGYIHFSTADKYNEGNAVIAAKNSSGEILWSWHIWFTDEPQGQEYYNNAGTMMDRNLGATSATPGDVGALGLLYQWGRKDPFLSSSDINGSIVTESTGSWPSAVSSSSSTGTIEYAVKNPMTFITRNSLNIDWYYPGSSSTDNTRWESEKTIYDPCPAGWRVPDGGSEGVWTKASGSSSSFDYTYSSTNEGMNFSGKFGSASTIWYPASGCRFQTDGSLTNVGGYGRYWSASPSNIHDFANNLYISYDGSVNPSYGNGRAFGLSVRCRKEGSSSPTPSEPEIINLSNKGLANSYIVSEAGSYKIVPTKGNSNESVGTISSVEVLWESFGTDVTPNVGDLVKNVKYADGAISFDTPSTFKEGNAVIAAKNSSDEILWSWHIWLTDEPQGQEYYNNAGTMMDRNLGATSATPGDVGAFGLLYQWGRKDPFLGSSSISSDIEAKSTGEWSIEGGTYDTDEYMCATNPMTFYTSSMMSLPDGSWDSVKTVYDPCPAGWRVPDGGENGVWAKAAGTSESFYVSYDYSNRVLNFSGKFGDATNIWYPVSGYRSDGDGNLYSVGIGGFYWSVSPHPSDSNCAFNLSFDYHGYVYPANFTGRADGYAVRCLQE